MGVELGVATEIVCAAAGGGSGGLLNQNQVRTDFFLVEVGLSDLVINFVVFNER